MFMLVVMRSKRLNVLFKPIIATCSFNNLITDKFILHFDPLNLCICSVNHRCMAMQSFIQISVFLLPSCGTFEHVQLCFKYQL